MFYGWNGSGKSTLSNLFRYIEKKTPPCPEKFPGAEFKVNIDENTIITQSNISESNLNIYTFNQEFIDDNIEWDGTVKSILLIDKTTIEERKKLEELKNQQRKDIETHSKKNEEIKNLENNIAKSLSASARRIKDAFRLIGTQNRHYQDYDKADLEKILKEFDQAKLNSRHLTDVEFQKVKIAAEMKKKPQINFIQDKINQQDFIGSKKTIDDLLTTTPTSKTIKRLVENTDINSWVEEGFHLHHNKTDQCEFCDNKITKERFEQLRDHFNNDYTTFKGDLQKTHKRISEQKIKNPSLPKQDEFYNEFQQEYEKACTNLEEAITGLNQEIAAWINALDKKITNPLATELTVNSISELSINTYNSAVTTLNEVIKKHNHKSKNFENEIDDAQKKLELHYAADEIITFDYYAQKKILQSEWKSLLLLKETIDVRRREISTLENSLSNENVAADEFNKSIHDFIGRGELTLQFNQEKRGYEMFRNGSEPVKQNLSEGEKTAIAFVYFITKLKENDNKIENTVVVVDDPISSFDSNHIFHAYSFMKMHCKKAKQLFVLTHNFTFFKLVRNWMSTQNKHGKTKADFYIIESNNAKPRASTYKSAPQSLMNYNSEYHYIFSRLYSFKGKSSLETDDHFLAANLARRLLESFLAFKFPENPSNFAALLNKAVKFSQSHNDGSKEKILRFVHQYSHSDSIGMEDGFVESLAGESLTIIGNIFDWIKELDEHHYKEMVEIVK